MHVNPHRHRSVYSIVFVFFCNAMRFSPLTRTTSYVTLRFIRRRQITSNHISRVKKMHLNSPCSSFSLRVFCGTGHSSSCARTSRIVWRQIVSRHTDENHLLFHPVTRRGFRFFFVRLGPLRGWLRIPSDLFFQWGGLPSVFHGHTWPHV